MSGIVNDLNSRQWQLYNYLKDKGDDWTNLYDIALDLKGLYVYPFHDDIEKKTFNNSYTRRILTADIQEINSSPRIQKIIIYSNKGIKLANEAEFNKFINKKYIAVFKKIKRLRQIEVKAKQDKQMRLVFGSERDTIEAFINELM